MKIKKEEGIKTEEIEKEKIKKEDEEDVVVESSLFRASLANPSSPPSARRTPPTRPLSPAAKPNPPPSASASHTVAVAVARPTTPVRNDERSGSVDPSQAQAVAQPVQALRRSPRKRKGPGETRTSLDTGDGDGDGDDTRPPKKMKKMRRVGRNLNPRAREVDLDNLPNLGALPEHLAEDLDGTFLSLANPTRAHAAF